MLYPLSYEGHDSVRSRALLAPNPRTDRFWFSGYPAPLERTAYVVARLNLRGQPLLGVIIRAPWRRVPALEARPRTAKCTYATVIAVGRDAHETLSWR